MDSINTIRTLKKQGWSKRRIARERKIDRQTIRKYLRADSESPTLWFFSNRFCPRVDERIADPIVVRPGGDQTRMALSLGPCFSRVIFCIAISMRNVLEFPAVFSEQGKGLGPAFERAGFAATGPLRHPIQGQDFQQLGH